MDTQRPIADVPPERRLLRSPALRSIELNHGAEPLMERAGAAAARLAARLQNGLGGRPIIFAGPGNNGGDAFVTARLLKQQGLDPCLVFRADPARLPPDARLAHQAWLAVGGEIFAEIPEGHFGLAIDGLFGIGMSRPAEGIYAQWIHELNQYQGPVLALDCPSGLNADTGAGFGAVVRASHTLSFIADKPGLHTLDGPDHAGIVLVDSLALDIRNQTQDAGRLLVVDDFKPFLPRRARNSHKGKHGSAGIIGGAPGMAGAALLAGRAALSMGAGRVYVDMLERLAVDPMRPELMLRNAKEVFACASALAFGPGLGSSNEAQDLLRPALESELPLLIDADGLNLLAAHPALHRHVAQRKAPTLLTPHPLEAARLLDQSLAAVQNDRIEAAKHLARHFRAAVVLKGVGSVLASPEGSWAVNTSGNPALASAGTGDILSGMALAFLAQGMPAAPALAAAVHLHGLAADHLVAQGQGPVGLAAMELLEPARAQLNRWIANA
ncbi:MAG: NAD(P)H-hydrate dehydratase [Rhodocyclaceae bacterium]|nr:MAG: NAD(P)H-hydrate dehydratase [Rhodocyclaceae bacterium]